MMTTARASSDPVTIAVLGDDDATERIRNGHSEADATTATSDEVLEWADRETVESVLVAESVDASSNVAALRERSESLPVFVLADVPGVVDALDAGATGCLPRPDEETAEVVADRLYRAATKFRERRILERESDMSNSMMESIPASVYFKDEAGRHLRVSRLHVDHPERGDLITPDGERITTEAGYIGKTDKDLFPAELAEQSYADDTTLMEQEDAIVDKVEKIPHQQGGNHWVTTTKVPWYDDGGDVQGLIGFTYQVTERKFRELQLERQNDRLDEFVQLVSHDLRNPLSVASGAIDLVEETGDVSRLEQARTALTRAEELIDDLGTIAKHGAPVDTTDTIDLEACVDRGWETVDTAAATLHDAVRGETISADESRLLQLFENFFRNAVEHAGEDVTITVGLLEGGFFVQDDGPGIPPDEREQVFRHGYTTDEGGTGFGLSIVRSIADAHGWSVRLADSDAGARFEVTDVSGSTGVEAQAAADR